MPCHGKFTLSLIYTTTSFLTFSTLLLKALALLALFRRELWWVIEQGKCAMFWDWKSSDNEKLSQVEMTILCNKFPLHTAYISIYWVKLKFIFSMIHHLVRSYGIRKGFLSLHLGSLESHKTQEQKFIFQSGTLNPRGINEHFSFK